MTDETIIEIDEDLVGSPNNYSKYGDIAASMRAQLARGGTL